MGTLYPGFGTLARDTRLPPPARALYPATRRSGGRVTRV